MAVKPTVLTVGYKAVLFRPIEGAQKHKSIAYL